MGLFEGITRRGFFRASAAGAVAATTVGLVSGCFHRGEEASEPVVVDERSAVSVLAEDSPYTEADLTLKEQGSWSLPAGTVMRQGEGTWLACIAPSSSATPVVKAAAFSTSTGKMVDVITSLQMGEETNVSIYDVRCSDKVYAWIEMDMYLRTWKLFAQQFSDGSLTGQVSMLWEADAEWDPPLLAVTGDTVVWQVMPSLTGSHTTEHSFCYLWHLGGSDAQAVVDSPGRFATPPAISNNTVTLVPRVRADEGVYYGITAYNLKDDLATVVDQLVLPQSVRPFFAVYMNDRFAFSIEANYSSGGLLGQMGTYIGVSEGPFVALIREPFAQVAGSGSRYIVKSRASYFVLDIERETYAILAATNRCVDYGEYPASEGTSSQFVTFATVKDPDNGQPTGVTVRSFAL